MLILLGLSTFFVIAVLLAVIVYIGYTSRAARLRKRPKACITDLLVAMGMLTKHESEIGREVLEGLGAKLGVDPCFLLPSDRFRTELALVPAWIGIPDSHLESFRDDLVSILYRHGITASPPATLLGAASLDDLMRWIKTSVAESEKDRTNERTAADIA